MSIIQPHLQQSFDSELFTNRLSHDTFIFLGKVISSIVNPEFGKSCILPLCCHDTVYSSLCWLRFPGLVLRLIRNR